MGSSRSSTVTTSAMPSSKNETAVTTWSWGAPLAHVHTNWSPESRAVTSIISPVPRPLGDGLTSTSASERADAAN